MSQRVEIAEAHLDRDNQRKGVGIHADAARLSFRDALQLRRSVAESRRVSHADAPARSMSNTGPSRAAVHTGAELFLSHR